VQLDCKNNLKKSPSTITDRRTFKYL
jgi:hypothetical protein